MPAKDLYHDVVKEALQKKAGQLLMTLILFAWENDEVILT